jgi:hypothetical protein
MRHFADLALPPQPWAPETTPDAEEWADWVYGLDREQLARYLGWFGEVRHTEAQCFMRDHEGQIAALSQRIRGLEVALDESLRRGHRLTTTIKDGTR